MENRMMVATLIEDIREVLAKEYIYDSTYNYLRGKLMGMFWADALTHGEFRLWNEFLYMKRYDRHSDTYIMEMFTFNK